MGTFSLCLSAVLMLVGPVALHAENPVLAEAEAFGRDLERAVAQKDAHFLDQRMDVRGFIEGVLSAQMSPEQKLQLEAGLLQNFQPGRMLMPQLSKNDYTYLRAIQR